jgi:transposase
MKQVIDLRRVHHRREDRIRAHVILCWVALLLARIAENAVSQTWPELRRELGRIHIATFTGPAGAFRQRTELTKPQRDILKALEIEAPPRIYQMKLPVTPSDQRTAYFRTSTPKPTSLVA